MASQTIKLPVTGMTCGNCAQIIERKLKATPGVSQAQVDLQAAIATVDFDPSRAKPSDLINIIEQLGFQVRQ